MSPKKIGLVIATVAVLGAGAVAGASLAGAATKSPTAQSYGKGPGGWDGGRPGSGEGGGRGGPSQDTPVTGAQKDEVVAAVTAKHPTVTILSVRKDPDGSFDALGTRSGAPVMYDVSKDLKTITENAHRPGGHGPGVEGQPPGTPPESTS
jgi:hypothetical protein